MKWWLFSFTLDLGIERLVAWPEQRGQFLALLGDKLGDAQEGRGSRAQRVGRG